MEKDQAVLGVQLLMDKIVLSLDQSSRITGYAVFINGKLDTFGKFIFDDADIDVRLMKIRNKIEELINLHAPNEVVYEDIQQQNNITNNVQTFKVLAEVFGVLSELFAELNIKHTPVLASSWKSTLNIKGRNRTEQKRNAQQYVIDNYGVKPTQDECDAICIGAHHIISSVNDWSLDQ